MQSRWWRVALCKNDIERGLHRCAEAQTGCCLLVGGSAARLEFQYTEKVMKKNIKSSQNVVGLKLAKEIIVILGKVDIANVVGGKLNQTVSVCATACTSC